jgi:uncharacterized caspase-like protein
MASHWPLIIGINQYQALQPLLFAQFDALELKDFLVNEAGLPPQQCSLLTDISPMVYQGAAFPTREVILQRFQQVSEQAGIEDTIWFFFSGYGVHWQGHDYLLPIDGDPSRIAETGIAIQAVFDLLQRSAARQRLLVLDMNRSQSALPNQRLGVRTMELAKQLDIPLLLSCRPNQFSQETLAVRHGLFTEAILEGLRFHGCLTLSQLAAYLHARVPELCQHHFRPEQNPVSVIPTEQQFLMLVPPEAVSQMAVATAPNQGIGSNAVTALRNQTGTVSEAPSPGYGRGAWAGITPAPTSPPYDGHAGVQEFPSDTIREAGTVETVNQTANPESLDRSDDGSRATTAIRWPLWLLIAAAVLLLGVLLRNQSTFLGNRQTAQGNGTAVEAIGADGSPSTEVPPAAEDGATPPIQDQVPGEPLFPIQGGGGVEPQMALEQARAALDQRRFGEALNWLSQIPEDQRPEDFVTLQERAQAGYDNTSRTGEEILSSARQIIEPLSASLFNDAIEEARQVPAGDPVYDQAQIEIARWSQVILDLAQGRAARGDFDAAIAAATLVPQDQGEVYNQAQSLIQQWQQQQVNRQLLQEAQAQLQPDQATSFEAAIQLAQQVPPNTPEYDVSQERIDQWSEDILVIARARAADGQLPGAIAAAELVPPGTSAYDQAQEEIQRWQAQ